jgi:hypothetical protein
MACNRDIFTLRSWALHEKLSIVQPFRKLRNPKVHHRVHKSPPLVPILSQFDPVFTIPSYLSKIHFNIVHPPMSWFLISVLVRTQSSAPRPGIFNPGERFLSGHWTDIHETDEMVVTFLSPLRIEISLNCAKNLICWLWLNELRLFEAKRKRQLFTPSYTVRVCR